MSTEEAPPGPGHNKPPELISDRTSLVPAETITALLKGEYDGDMKTAMDRRVGSLKITDVNDENAAKVQDFMAQIKASSDHLEEKRKLQRDPFRLAADQVQKFFKPEIDALEKEYRRLARILGFYDDERRKKEEKQKREEREKAEKEQAELAQKAEAEKARAAELAAAGDRTAATEALSNAEAAQEGAKEAGKTVRRSLTVSGIKTGNTSSSVRRKTTFEVVDMDALEPAVLWGYLDRADIDRAIQNYIDDQEDQKLPLALKGVTFDQDVQSVVRRKKQ